MSKYSDTVLHRIEILLTLDYLLKYTDVNHPATQQEICRYARTFGLRYEGGKPGDDVRRQRIGDCLQWLQAICYKFANTDKIPFMINSTDSGKFYIEEKNHLNEEQIIKILAAIQNDKYTKDGDTDLLINKLLDFLSNKHNREFYLQELEKENKRVKKYNALMNRKLRLINEAFKEKKSILIIQTHFGRLSQENNNDNSTIKPKVNFGNIEEKIYYRVYRIEEHNNKPYAILIPINRHGVIFDAVENLNIPHLPKREVLMEDETSDNRLNELFKINNKFLAKYYESLDEYVAEQIVPEDGLAFKSSFYFEYRFAMRVKKSFEEYFGKEIPIIKCDKFKIDKRFISHGKAIEIPRKVDEYAIKCEKYEGDGNPKFGVVNITINRNALVSWLFNNPSIADVIDVVAPISINSLLGNRFLEILLKYQDDIGKETIIKAMETGRYHRYKHNRYQPLINNAKLVSDKNKKIND